MAKRKLTPEQQAYRLKLKRQAQMASKAYGHLSTILHLTGSTKETAERLGVSSRTVRRWKAEGVPAASPILNRRKIAAIASGLKRKEKGKRVEQRKEPEAFYYYRFYDGLAVKHYNVEGASYEQMLDIILRECLYSSRPESRRHWGYFTLLMKATAPFEGLWTEDGLITRKQLESMSGRQRQKVKGAGSWLDATLSDPFFSSYRVALIPDMCHPDDFTDILDRHFGQPYAKIVEIRFVQMRTE